MDLTMSEQVQPKEEGIISRALTTLVFWWLTTMGTVALALAAIIPMWTEHRQVVQVRDQLQQQVETLQKRVDRNSYFIKAYTEDPEAIDMLAVTNLRYRRADEAVLPLPTQVVSQVRPIGWSGETTAADRPASPARSAAKTLAEINPVERYVEKAKRLSRKYLGPARSIALVEMFCDSTCRKALTGGALAVLAAALFLCKPIRARESS